MSKNNRKQYKNECNERLLEARCERVEEGVHLVRPQLVGQPAGVGAHVREAHVSHDQVARVCYGVTLTFAQLLALVIEPGGGDGLAGHGSTPQDGVRPLLHHQGGAPDGDLRGARLTAQVTLRPVGQLDLGHRGELLFPGSSTAFILANGLLGSARQSQLGNGLSKACSLLRLILGQLEVWGEKSIFVPGHCWSWTSCCGARQDDLR